MKRFAWIFALLLFSLSVSAADYEECYSDCKLGPYGDCIAAGGVDQDCYKTAFEPCVAQCPVPEQDAASQSTPSVRATSPQAAQSCVERCKTDYLACSQGGTDPADCAKRAELCEKENCLSATPPMTCEAQCKTEAENAVRTSPQAVGGQQLVEQFYARCVESHCRAEPQAKPVPAIQPASPQAVEASACLTQPRDDACEVQCAQSYYGCAKNAEGLTISEEKRDLMLRCYEGVGECLDACRPGMIAATMTGPAEPETLPETPPDCVTACKQEYDACSASSTDASECKTRADACFRKCAPQPAAVTEPAAGAQTEAAPVAAPTAVPEAQPGFWRRLMSKVFGR